MIYNSNMDLKAYSSIVNITWATTIGNTMLMKWVNLTKMTLRRTKRKMIINKILKEVLLHAWLQSFKSPNKRKKELIMRIFL